MKHWIQCVIVLLLFMPNNEVLLGEANGDSDGMIRVLYCAWHVIQG